MTRYLIGLAGVIFCAASVTAQQQYVYTTYGAGNQSCGKWVQEAVVPPREETYIYYAWATGFLSGVGYVGEAPMRETDSAAMTLWITNYCRANPLETIAVAAGKLTRELKR